MTPEDLVTIHEITQLKYRYQRAIDTQDWDLLATVFTPTARAWYDSGSLATEGRDNIVAMLSGALRPVIYSSHIVLHPEIVLTSPTTAKGIWRFEDVVHFAAPDPWLVALNIKGGERLSGAGYYHDEYEKVDGQWKIASTGYVRIFESTELAQDNPNMKLRVEQNRGKLKA